MTVALRQPGFETPAATVPVQWPRAVGAGTAETTAILQDAMGKDAGFIVPWMHGLLPNVVRHGFNTARFGFLALEHAREQGNRISDEMQTGLVLAGFLHDIGKTDRRIAPLVDYPGYYDNQQRARMKQHAPIGGLALGDLAWRSASRGDFRRADLYDLSAGVAYDHHTYSLPYPRSGTDHEKWEWEATVITQNIDRPESMTDPTRTYVGARLRSEGDADVYAALDRQLQGDYGASRTDPLPLTGLSPQDIVEIVLYERAQEAR